MIETVLVLWALTEILFYLFIKYFTIPILETPTHKQDVWFKQPQDILHGAFQLMHTFPSHYPFDNFVSGFCHKSDIKSIHSIHFERFLAWALYESSYKDLCQNKIGTIQKFTQEVSERFSKTWAPDIMDEIPHCKFSLEPLDYIHHPLILYTLFGIMDKWCAITILYKNGFTKQHHGTATYWVKEVSNATHPPILIFHGICSGWISYSAFIRELAIENNRTIILYDNAPIQHCSLNFHTQTADELCTNVREILEIHKIPKVQVCGHSWGTFSAGWVIRKCPDIVDHLILIDPVCLTIYFPESTYFILNKPSTTISDYMVEYFVRGDLSISYAIKRHFKWYNSAIGLDEIPGHIHTTIYLSENDSLVPFSLISNMIDAHNKESRETCPIQKQIWYGKEHGYGICDSSCIKQLIHLLE